MRCVHDGGARRTGPNPSDLSRLAPVALIEIDNPPVNATSQAVRAGLLAAIQEVERSPQIEAAVIACTGRTFVAGADIREFGQTPREPHLPDVIDAIEACSKPVVAAVHGTALGGGCEIALACHARVAVPDASFGMPEVKLGLVPGAGGTQASPPRRIGGRSRSRDERTNGEGRRKLCALASSTASPPAICARMRWNSHGS